MSKKKKKKSLKKIWSLLIIIIAIFYSLYEKEINETFGLPTSIETFQEETSQLTITYLDVGQADSILIQNENQNLLIDTGNNEDGPLLVKYFQENNIQKFHYLIATHPHEDHIGGLDNIINSFEVNTIYMPDAITTTKTFLDVLDALESHNLTYKVPQIGETFNLGNATLKVIHTGTDTHDLNNTSIVLKLIFGNTSFLFTGDATSQTEKEILSQDIKTDVLKIGHHGSKYSTTKEFLDKVNPKYAIISVGKDNTYNHPSSSTIQKLQEKNIQIHRTDQEGSIILKSDGHKITITTQKTNTNGG